MIRAIISLLMFSLVLLLASCAGKSDGAFQRGGSVSVYGAGVVR